MYKRQRLDTLNIVGGGIQNKLLNQMAADALDRPVITGPIEGAAIGNLLLQAVALGELKDIAEVRQVGRKMCIRDRAMWDWCAPAGSRSLRRAAAQSSLRRSEAPVPGP